MPSQSRSTPARWIGAAVLGLCLLGLALPPPADAFVYWTNGTSIGRATLEGAGVNKRWIDDVGFADRLAVDRRHIYWTTSNGNAIGRAAINGTGIDESFVSGDSQIHGVAVDGDHIYWANPEAGTIGRANLDGTGADQAFISGAEEPNQVAVDADYVYWANRGTKTIGRAKLDGTDANQSFITILGFPGGLAVDASHLYWVNANIAFDFSGAIGRAKLNGSDVNQIFTFTPGVVPTFLSGVAVDAGHLYWADFAVGAIVRATLDGTADSQFFISGLDGLFGPGLLSDVAVDARPFPAVIPPETTITKRPPNKTRKRNVKFRFVSSEPDSSFRCKLDGEPFEDCESPTKFKRLSKGKHKFKVRAINAAGIADPTPAKDRFRVLR